MICLEYFFSIKKILHNASKSWNSNTLEKKIIQELKEKPEYYIKKDRENAWVVLDLVPIMP